MHISLVTERRVFAPKGIKGGHNGKRGINYMITPDGPEYRGKKVNLGGKQSLNIGKKTRIIIETPGGGGFGNPEDKQQNLNDQKKDFIFEGIGSYNQSLKLQEQG